MFCSPGGACRAACRGHRRPRARPLGYPTSDDRSPGGTPWGPVGPPGEQDRLLQFAASADRLSVEALTETAPLRRYAPESPPRGERWARTPEAEITPEPHPETRDRAE